MRVCHCHNITDRDIRAAVRSAAAGGSESVSALLAGTSCGGCMPLVEEITDSVLAECASAAAWRPRGPFPVLVREHNTDAEIRASLR
jgi:bacterioferritin-associated ferredoxin